MEKSLSRKERRALEGTVALIKAKSDDEAKQIAVKTYGVDAYVKPNWSVSYSSRSDVGWY